MKIIYNATILLLTLNYCLVAQTNMQLVSQVPYDQFVNDIWGYTAPDGTEYALVGLETGVSIVSLADKVNPKEVAFIPGSIDMWRDLKTYNNRAYVVTEAQDGLLVIDLTQLPDTTSHFFWRTTLAGETDSLGSVHNLYIDEQGYCYLSGATLNSGGFLIVDVFSDPNQPKLVGKGPAVYSHDIYVRDNIAYSSDIEAGNLTIHDVSNKDSVRLLGMQQTPVAFCHNAWLSDDSKTIFTTEERENAPTTAYDISDFSDIKELDRFVPLATKGKGVIPHNTHVLNDFLITSHYGDGCVVVDAARPDNLIEVGNYDTDPEGVGGLVGSWGAYPYLPSGLILATDTKYGLFVLEPTYVRACYLEGVITDTAGIAIPNVTVTFSGTATSENSNLKGEIKTGLVTAGQYEVIVSKRGYQPRIVMVEMKNGEVTTLDIVLEPATASTISGMVVQDGQGTPIGGVSIQLIDGDSIVETMSDDTGQFMFENVLPNAYTIYAGKWGYKLKDISDMVVDASSQLNIQLEKGYEDPFIFDFGWTVVDEENLIPFKGFERDVPVPAEDLPIISTDAPEDIGDKCYISGNLPAFVDHIIFIGKSTLSSPTFDISDMMHPRLNYSYFFTSVDLSVLDNGNDTLFVYLDNGTEQTVIENIVSEGDFENFIFNWRNSTINVSEYLTPTATMKIIFEFDSTSELTGLKAAVDNFKVWDAGTVSTQDFIDESLTFKVYPNPAHQQLSIQYSPQDWEQTPSAVIYNSLGKKVYQQHLGTDASLSLPTTLPTGVYFIQLVNGLQGSSVIKLVKR